jgi:hypothetical protein
MKLPAKWLAVLVLGMGVMSGVDHRPAATAKWTIDLKDKFNFQPFDRPITFRWTVHQDVVFLPPDKLIVYQVNRARGPVQLRPRDASGGGGNFVLDIRILSILDGHELAAIHLTTSADSSKVLATRNGRFIVRTGEILYLYSANFEIIAAKTLPLNRQVQEEDWQFDVSPSGYEVVLVHTQIFKRNQLSPASDVRWASADVEVLNEENLQPIKRFSLPWYLPFWAAGEHILISPRPQFGADPSVFGVLDYNGNWSPLLLAMYSPTQPCAFRAKALDARFVVTYGCEKLKVFPQNGKEVFSLRNSSKEFVGSVKGSGSNLAVQVERHFTKLDRGANISIELAKPLRIDVYDYKSHKGMLSAPVHSDRVYYALSSQGAVAAVDGTSLTLYQAAR